MSDGADTGRVAGLAGDRAVATASGGSAGFMWGRDREGDTVQEQVGFWVGVLSHARREAPQGRAASPGPQEAQEAQEDPA